MLWYTNAALENPVHVDVICYLGQGSIAAVLRLWIDKDDNGCYFLAYVFQTPDGGYLCCLFQCAKKNWTETQEAAENFVNTFRWGDSNVGS